MLCDKTQQCTADILIPHERAVTLVFWHQQWLVGDAPSVWNLHSKWATPFEKCWLRQISADNVSAIRDSEKSSIMTNRKSTTGFPTSYRRRYDHVTDAIANLHWLRLPLTSTRQQSSYVIIWRLRGNIIRTALCWIGWHKMFTIRSTLIWAVLTGSTDWACHIATLTLCIEAVA